MSLVVQDAELSRGDTVDGFGGFDTADAATKRCQRGAAVVGGVAYLYRYAEGAGIWGVGDDGHSEPVDVVYEELRTVGTGRVVAMREIDDVAADVFLHHKPRPAAEAQTLTLAYRGKPMALVSAHKAARLYLYSVALALAEIHTEIVVVVDLAEETDALRILAARIDETVLQGDATHLLFHQMPDGEDGFLKLPLIELRKEVGLVLDRVGTGAEPFPAIAVSLRSGIVSGGDEVVVAAALVVEGAELDEAIAHNIGVGSIAVADLLHRVVRHAVPILTVTAHNLKTASVATAEGGSHLKVFF